GWRILRNEFTRTRQDGGARAAVLRQMQHLRSRKAPRELFKRSARRSAEAIDGLVGIADGKNVLLFSREQRRQFDLRDVGVLELIEQQKTRALALLRQDGSVAAEQFDRAQ